MKQHFFKMTKKDWKMSFYSYSIAKNVALKYIDGKKIAL